MTASFRYFGPDRIRATVGFRDVIAPVAAALVDFSGRRGQSPAMVFAPAGRGGDVHVKAAWLPGRPIFTVKVATWFEARGVALGSPLGGLVAAFDARTGDLRALLEDDHHLSDIRTAAAGALAARHLAVADAQVLGVIGTGVQAYLQALAVAGERPIREIRVWGRSPEKASRVAAAIGARLPGRSTRAVDSAMAAVAAAQVVVTATASTEPLVQADWIAPGGLVIAIGADDASKCELDPTLLARADRLVVDSRELASRYGDVAHAMSCGALPSGFAGVEIGDIVAGRQAGRTCDAETVVCKLVGLGVQDLAATEVALALLDEGTPARNIPESATDIGEGRSKDG